MAHKADWEQANQGSQPYWGSADDSRDGFIHFSTADQIKTSASKHRFGQTDLLLIAVYAERLGDALMWEKSRDDNLFPHLYGPLNPELALSALPLPWNENKQVHIFPPLSTPA